MQRRIRKKIKELAQEFDLPESVVQKAWESQFRILKEINKDIDLKELEIDQIKELKTNVNWKYIGKLFIDYTSIKKKRELWEKTK